MGTNFYHRTKICSECGKYDERHIGKNSMGWQFSFRGHIQDDEEQRGLIVIQSWAHWKEVLKEGKIFDEYGDEVAYDDFVALIERSRGKKNHYDYVSNSVENVQSFLQDMWKDAEGWDFSSTGFS